MLPIDQDDDGNLIYPDGIEPYVARTTERTNFKKCRRLWNYTSQNRMNLEPVKMNRNLAFGIDVHLGAEAYYDPEWWDETSPEEKTQRAVEAFVKGLLAQKDQEVAASSSGLSDQRLDEYADMEMLGIGMLRHYGEWAPRRDKALGLKPLYVEHKFQIPIMKDDKPLVINERPVVYQVRIDLVAEHKDGLWLWDHKTAKNVTGDTSFLDLDTQLSSYLWAWARKTGKIPIGMMYNELRKEYPKEPRILKSGKLSQDKSQLTNLALYRRAIEELSLDPADYSDMLNYLAGTDNPYFRRTPIKRTGRELLLQGQYVVDEVRDMFSDPSIYPNPSKMHCGGCDFRHPSLIENEGGDVEFVLSDRSMFKLRDEEEDLNATKF